MAVKNLATTVVALQNHPVAATTPTTGQVLTFGGTNWAPAALPTPARPVAIAFPFTGLPGTGALVIVPATVAMTIVAALAGSLAVANTAATADATFNVTKWTGGSSASPVALGTIVFHAAGAPTISGAGGTLAIGDALVVTAPSPQDATLANVGITLLLTSP